MVRDIGSNQVRSTGQCNGLSRHFSSSPMMTRYRAPCYEKYDRSAETTRAAPSQSRAIVLAEVVSKGSNRFRHHLRIRGVKEPTIDPCNMESAAAQYALHTKQVRQNRLRLFRFSHETETAKRAGLSGEGAASNYWLGAGPAEFYSVCRFIFWRFPSPSWT